MTPLENYQQIQAFLESLDHSQREAFQSYASNCHSIYEIWLYATVLRYSGSFIALEEWVENHYPKLNKLEILLTEIVKIEADIDLLRQEVQSGMMRPGDSATRISHLSKELRGHVVEADRIQVARDRRGLIMAGADKVMRELKSIVKGNEEMTNALELAYESVWSDIASEA